MSERNNARLHLTSPYLPIHKAECIDEDKDIWRGEIVPSTEEEESYGKEVIFSRRYLPEHNEMDLVFQEIEFTDDLLGIPFTLVPKDKILFLYTPHTTILRVAPKDPNKKNILL